MEIIVDNKENDKFISKLSEKTKIMVKSLDLGDIAFNYGGNQVLLIERKTIGDLAASLNDGRYHEQKARLKSHINSGSGNVIYLIEGKYEDLDKKYHGNFNKEKYKGCIINTMIRDQIPVYQAADMGETVEFIIDIAKRIPKYVGEIGKKDINEAEYAALLKAKKKENITGKVCYLNQLRQIPGVSANMAEKIAEKYATMSELIGEYRALDDEKARKAMLRDLRVADSRKLGPVVAERIYHYLFNKE